MLSRNEFFAKLASAVDRARDGGGNLGEKRTWEFFNSIARSERLLEGSSHPLSNGISRSIEALSAGVNKPVNFAWVQAYLEGAWEYFDEKQQAEQIEGRSPSRI